jgi:hypothetical protein
MPGKHAISVSLTEQHRLRVARAALRLLEAQALQASGNESAQPDAPADALEPWSRDSRPSSVGQETP